MTMSDLYVKGTRQSPEVDFRFSQNFLSLKGEAYPENAVAFFTPLTQAASGYLESSGNVPVLVQMDLRYLNSASTKMLFQFIGVLDKAASTGRKITIEFAYEADDDMLMEFAEDLKSDFTWVDIQLHELA